MKAYNLLLLDADNTLFDFAKAEKEAFHMACEAMDIPAAADQYAKYSEINRALWRAFERNEVTQDELRVLRVSRFLEAIGARRDAVQMADHFVEALSLQTQEIDGALAFVRGAAERMPVVIVTNGIAAVQKKRFSLSPMGKHISGMVISGEEGFAKPDPRMIRRAVEIGGNPGATPLMIGDEPASDIAAANAAGVDSCWYNPGGRANETFFQPTHEIKTLKEAMRWL